MAIKLTHGTYGFTSLSNILLHAGCKGGEDFLLTILNGFRIPLLLKIDNQIYYKNNDCGHPNLWSGVSLPTVPEEIRLLIDYIVGLSNLS